MCHAALAHSLAQPVHASWIECQKSCFAKIHGTKQRRDECGAGKNSPVCAAEGLRHQRFEKMTKASAVRWPFSYMSPKLGPAPGRPIFKRRATAGRKINVVTAIFTVDRIKFFFITIVLRF